MIKKILFFAACAVLFMSVTLKDNVNKSIVVDDVATQWAQEELDKMTADEKIGQLFMMSLWSEWSDSKLQETYDEAANCHVGGVCFFAGEAAREIQITNRLNAQANIPLLIGIDGEWGPGMRVTDAHSFPYAMNVGAVADSALVLEMGRQIGEHCRRLGIHVNFAPVHDLNSNPLNPVINYRSYGSDVDNVSAKAAYYVEGMQSEGVLAVAKHFPGHGDTQTDSHHALPVINKTRAQFEAQEFVPFRHSMEHGLQAIMMGHLNVPALDENDMPASLSSDIIRGIVKGDIGFDGLIISDALNMDAVAKGYDKHYLKAFKAGIDILLFPASLTEGVKQLKDGLSQGLITTEELDARCMRVLQYKYALGVHDFTPLSADHITEDLNPAESKVLSRQLLTKSITLVRNTAQALPIQELETKTIAAISINNENTVFTDQFKAYGDVTVFNESVHDAESVLQLVAKLKTYDEVIVGIHGNQKKRSGNYAVNSYALNLLYDLAKHTKVHGVVMANPYAIRKMSQDEFNHLSSLMFAYGNDATLQSLSAQAIFGGISVEGILPLDINDYLKVGVSFQTQDCRLGYSDVPEEVGLDASTLLGIETVAQEVIDQKMSPGCQVLVARRGKVVYQKSFGYMTYDHKQPLANNNLFDIASVTKIGATTPLVMQMKDAGLLDIDTPICNYLPELDTTDKAQLTMKQLMLHQAGLKSYIAFDFNLIDEEKLEGDLFHRGRTTLYNIPLTESLYINGKYQMKQGYISSSKDDHFSVQVANDMYTFSGYRQEMFNMMDTLPLADNKKYRYSDLGFYYSMRILEAQSHQSIDQLAKHKLYTPLGMNNTCYTPLACHNKKDIVPTVDEVFFRKQLLQGYVHDQGAALMGGVAGHAGLFSNANDLAKLMQMYLNDGFYGGQSYIQPQTVHYFTQHREQDYRRGIGFDKPETHTDRPQPTCAAASPSAFGHTGFTGAGVWADPQSELIYIFLSNRVHPHTYNTALFQKDIRPRIQAIIYDSIID